MRKFWTQRMMREATGWIVVGLGLAVVTMFLPQDTPLAVRLVGMVIGAALVALSLRQLALGRREREEVQAVCAEIDDWIMKADQAAIEVIKAQIGASGPDRKQDAFERFFKPCAAFVKERFGDAEHGIFVDATKLNLYGKQEFPAGEYVGSLLVYQARLERLRASLFSGRIATTTGLTMPD